MATSLRILLLEDNPTDAELILYQLRRDGFEPIWQRVELADDYANALNPGLDIVLADFSLPHFDAVSALQVLQDRHLGVPFIIVSGTISEELAIDCMKRGAADYILKDRLARLGQAVRHALEAKKARDEQRRAEAVLLEYEASFRLLAERAHDVIFRYRLHPTPGLDFVSPAVTKTTGYSPEEFYADPGLASRICLPEDRLTFHNLVLAGDLPQPVTLRIRHRNGSLVWLELSTVALRDDSGEPLGAEGIARDVTERALSEQALRESEQKYRTLVEAIDDPVLVKDAAGRYTVVNDAAARMHGRAKEEFIGKSAAELFEPGVAHRVMEDDRRVVAEGVATESETGHLQPEGRKVYHRRKVPLRDAAGQVVGIVSVSRDITERKRAEAELRESEARFRAVFAQAAIGMALTDAEGRLLDTNPAFQAMLGYSGEELSGLMVADLTHPEDIARESQLVRGIMMGQTDHCHIEKRYLRKGGDLMRARLTISPVRGEGNPNDLVIGLVEDITEWKQAETALRESQSLLASIYETVPVGICVTDEAGRFMEANSAFCRIFDYPRGNLIGQHISTVVPHAVHGCLEAAYARLVRGEARVPAEIQLRRRDGRIVEIGAANALLVREDGQRLVVTTVNDISERKQAQEAWTRLAAIVESSQDAIVGETLAGVITSWNPAAERLYGYTAAEVVGRSISMLFPPDRGDELAGILARISAGQRTPSYDTVRRRKDGSLVDVSVSISPLTDGEGRVVGASGIVQDISERKMVAEAIRESEEKYRTLVECASDSILVHIGGRYVFANPAALAMLGAGCQDEILGRSLFDFVHPDYLELTQARFARFQAEGRRLPSVETKRVRLDGTVVDVEVEAIPLVYQGLPAVQDVMRDVTERNRAQQALRESEERYRNLVENAHDGILVHIDGKYAFANPAALRLLGASRPEDLIGKTIADFVHPDYLATAKERIAQVAAGSTSLPTAEETRVRVDGTVVDVEVAAIPIIYEGKSAIQTIVRDISERKRAEEARMRLATIVESSDDAIISQTLAGVITSWNPAAERFYGYAAAEAIGQTLSIIIPPEQSDEKAAIIKRMGRGESIPSYDTIRRRKDGTRIDISASISPIRDRMGRPIGASGIDRDITKRKWAEEALRLSEARFRAVFENAVMGIVLTDCAGRIVEANPAYLRIMGYSLEGLRGLSVSDRVCSQDLPQTLDLLHQLVAGEQDYNQLQRRNVRKDGQLVWVNLISSMIRTAEGEPQYVLSLVEDITERREMEEQLQHAQRLEIAGRIAAQVAHDFNNLLVPVAGLPGLIKMRLPQGDPAAEMCDILLEAARSMAAINENMLALGRRGHVEQQPTDLNAVVKQAVANMPIPPATLAVRLDLAPGRLTVSGAQAQLLRVVTNLVANARDAMEDVGVLTIATAKCYLDGGQIGQYGKIEAGEYAKLTVSDTGCGIAVDVRDKIFDAFFTTKRTDAKHGSGLGLTVVQAVINDHHGYVDLETAEGRGTSFYIYLPVSRREIQNGLGGGLPEGDESVLVVDDDYFQRIVTTQMLQVLGYRVATVTSGEDAVAYVREHSPDLLILDMVMPGGMDGAATYRRILKARPGQKAIIVSGYAETKRVHQALLLGAGAFYQKPLTVETLAHAVRTELDRVV